MCNLSTELKCPDGFTKGDIDFANRKSYTLERSITTVDSPDCALKGVKGKGNCKKPNGRRKFWLTYRFGYGELTIKKFDRFSNLYSSSSDTSGTSASSQSDSSSFDIPQKFAISAIFFRVRGASQIIIKLRGDIGQTVCKILFRLVNCMFKHMLYAFLASNFRMCDV